MCQRCIEVYAGTKDVERPCRRPGCKHTWTDKRGAQLARAVRGKTGDPYPRYCTECEKEVGELEDREVPCKTEHCPGTWTWSAAQQLAAGVRPAPKAEDRSEDATRLEAKPTEGGEPALAAGEAPVVDGPAAEGMSASHEGDSDGAPEEIAQLGGAEDDASGSTTVATDSAEGAAPQVVATVPSAANGAGGGKRRRKRRRREIRPPDRRCDDCLAFLKDRKTREIPCGGCGTVIHWPPESQLQTHLGNWAEPTLCGACKRDLTEAARVAERDALRHPGTASPAPGSEGESPAPDATHLGGAVPMPTDPSASAELPSPDRANVNTTPAS